jgi:tryptophan synthase alpha chain
MNALTAAFDRIRNEGRLGLVGYLPAGYPDPDRFIQYTRAAFASGLDILEIGLPARRAPFDGDIIRNALEGLTAQGLNIEDALLLGGQVLQESRAPGIVMVYASELKAYGSQNLLQACARLGIAGVLPVGMHPSDWPGFARIAHRFEVAPIAFVSAQAEPYELNDFARLADGFLYLQSQNGSTGQQGDFGPDVNDRIANLRVATRSNPLPIAVGFGVRRPEDIAQIAALDADGAIVGTALVEAATQGENAVRDLVSSLSAAAQSASWRRIK